MQITMNKFSTISSNSICPPCVDVINRLLIARSESFSYEQYLLELLQIECEARRQNRIARNLRSSKLPPFKTFANFDKKRLPAMVAAHLNVLADGSFLNRCENVLAFGNPGSGKTHLLCAIGHQLIEQGRRVLFIGCSQLCQKGILR